MTYEAFLDDVGCLDDVDKAWSPRARQAAAAKRGRGRPRRASGAAVGGLVSDEAKRKIATGALAVGGLSAVAASQVVSQRRAARVAKSGGDDLDELDPEPFDKAWSPKARQAAAQARRSKGKKKPKKRLSERERRLRREDRMMRAVRVAGAATTGLVVAEAVSPFVKPHVQQRLRQRRAGRDYANTIFNFADYHGAKEGKKAHDTQKAEYPSAAKAFERGVRREYNRRAKDASMSRPDQFRQKRAAGKAERDFNSQIDAASNSRRARRARAGAYTVRPRQAVGRGPLALNKSVADDFDVLDVPDEVGKARKPKAAAQAARKKAAAAAGSPTPPKTAKKPEGPRPAAMCLDHAVRSFAGRQTRRAKLTRDNQKRAGKRQMRFNAHLEAAKSDSPTAQRRKAGAATLSKPKPKAKQPRQPRSRP